VDTRRRARASALVGFVWEESGSECIEPEAAITRDPLRVRRHLLDSVQRIEEDLMSSRGLSCPHCGHDGTRDERVPQPESYGFVHLTEELVSREVRGFDETGRLLLSLPLNGEVAQRAGVQILCRSCGRTFSTPEDLNWVEVPDEASPETQSEATSPELVQGGSGGTAAAAESIAGNLVAILQAVRQELEGVSASQFVKLEATRAALDRTVNEVHSVRADLRTETVERERREAALGDQIGELQQQSSQQVADATARIHDLAGTLQAEKEASGQLASVVAQLKEGQDALLHRLEAQAEVIRTLHAAAQEQMTRREELRAAAHRLEEIAGGLAHVEPLPDQL